MLDSVTLPVLSNHPTVSEEWCPWEALQDHKAEESRRKI